MANNIGSIAIVGTIDIESVKHGLRQLKQGLNDAKNAAGGAFGDLKRLGGTIASIAGPLGKIGAGLTATMLGIAALSPAIAPSLARMQVEFLRMSRILGEELKPVFEKVEELFVGFVAWLDGPQGRAVIEFFSNSITGAVALLDEALRKLKLLNDATVAFITPTVQAGGGIATQEERQARIAGGGPPRTLSEAGTIMGLGAAVGGVAGAVVAGAAGLAAAPAVVAGGAMGLTSMATFMLLEQVFGPRDPSNILDMIGLSNVFTTEQTPSYESMRYQDV